MHRCEVHLSGVAAVERCLLKVRRAQRYQHNALALPGGVRKRAKVPRQSELAIYLPKGYRKKTATNPRGQQKQRRQATRAGAVVTSTDYSTRAVTTHPTRDDIQTASRQASPRGQKFHHLQKLNSRIPRHVRAAARNIRPLEVQLPGTSRGGLSKSTARRGLSQRLNQNLGTTITKCVFHEKSGGNLPSHEHKD